MSKNQNVGFETDVYEEKIEELKRSYLQASILTGYYFYLPMLIGEEWIITQIINGTEKTISLDQLRRFLKHKKTEFNK